MKPKHIRAYMATAQAFADCSTAERLHVGAIVVKDDRIISIGYNGMPGGWDNTCEYRDYCLSRDFKGNYFPGTEERYPFEDHRGRYKLTTKPEVLHAEMNALMKLAKTGGGGADSTMFITHAPCMECAKGIYQAGIVEVYYGLEYRDSAGIEFLKKCNVKISKLDI